MKVDFLALNSYCLRPSLSLKHLCVVEAQEFSNHRKTSLNLILINISLSKPHVMSCSLGSVLILIFMGKFLLFPLSFQFILKFSIPLRRI